MVRQTARFIVSLIQIFSALLLLPVLFLLQKRPAGRDTLPAFIFFLIYAFFLRMLMLIGSPSPGIDVFIILKEAPLKLLQGINPYRTLYTAVFPGVVPDYYGYWPASFFFTLPFRPVTTQNRENA